MGSDKEHMALTVYGVINQEVTINEDGNFSEDDRSPPILSAWGRRSFKRAPAFSDQSLELAEIVSIIRKHTVHKQNDLLGVL